MRAQILKLNDLSIESPEVLVGAKSVFPLDLFPDSIAIDREKMTVTHRSFFMVSDTISVPIKDILNVIVNVGPFFGSLRIVTRFFDNKSVDINFLWRDDAIQIKRILAGYIIASQKEIDCSGMGKDELIPMLYRLGSGVDD